MNSRWSTCLLPLAVGVALLLPPSAAPAAGFDPAKLEPYPLPEWYTQGIASPKYVQDAKAWLDKNRESQYAPRVAIDLLMAGTIGNDPGLADGMRACLLLEHPGSGAAAYVMTQFKDGDEFGKFLRAAIDAHGERPRYADFGKRLAVAALRGGEKWGPDAIVAKDDVALVLAAVGQEIDPRLAEAVVERVRKKRAGDDELLRLLSLSVDPQLGTAEKVVALGGVERPAAAPLRGYLITRLTDADRANPPVVRVMAQEAIHKYGMSDALKLIDTHPAKDKDPQLLFWRVWCHGTAGERDKAAAVAKLALQKFPDDPWSKQCGQWVAHLAALDANLALDADALIEGTTLLRQGPSQLEMRLVLRPADGPPVSVYCGFAGGKSFDMHVTRDAKPLLAYHTSMTEASAFIAGEPAVQRFKERGPLPVPRLTLAKDAAGKFDLNFGFEFTNDPETAAAALRSVFSSPLLSTRDGVLDFMKAQTARGFMPAAPEAKDGGQVFEWLSPHTARPGLGQLQFVIGADQRLAGLSASGEGTTFAVESLNYGAAGSFEFKPPPWPQLPVVEREKMEMALMFKLLGVVANLMTDPGPAGGVRLGP